MSLYPLVPDIKATFIYFYMNNFLKYVQLLQLLVYPVHLHIFGQSDVGYMHFTDLMYKSSRSQLNIFVEKNLNY